jgi:ribose transport system ATP-binding protein
MSNDQPNDHGHGEPVLAIHGLVKRFTGTMAVDHVDLQVEAGEIHALLGANGAGKSTIIKILAGIYKPDEGEIRFAGKSVQAVSHRLPIAFIHQDLAVMDGLTVAENFGLVLGFPKKRGLIWWRRLADEARQALAAVGADIEPSSLLTSLSLAEKSIVSIARALWMKDVQILVLDEPTASLPEADVARLFDILRMLRSRGLAMLYVTHRLDEVFRIADRVTILRDGRRISTVPIVETTSDLMVSQIVGREADEVRPKAAPRASAPIAIELDGLCAQGAGPVSVRVKAGEVVGLVGLRGAGQDTIGRALFGAVTPTAGFIRLNSRPMPHNSPARSIRAGLGFVSSKRIEEGLAIDLTVRENLFLNPAILGRRLLEFMSRREERKRARRTISAFKIRPTDSERIMGTLSGGNQQRVALARWLGGGKVNALVLEEPTLGVDVGAKVDIYNELAKMAEADLAVVLVSADFDEVCTICDRALVFNRGQVVAELDRPSLSTAALVTWAATDNRVSPLPNRTDRPSLDRRRD